MKTLLDHCQEALNEKDSQLITDVIHFKNVMDEISNYTGDWFDAFMEQIKK